MLSSAIWLSKYFSVIPDFAAWPPVPCSGFASLGTALSGKTDVCTIATSFSMLLRRGIFLEGLAGVEYIKSGETIYVYHTGCCWFLFLFNSHIDLMQILYSYCFYFHANNAMYLIYFSQWNIVNRCSTHSRGKCEFAFLLLAAGIQSTGEICLQSLCAYELSSASLHWGFFFLNQPHQQENTWLSVFTYSRSVFSFCFICYNFFCHPITKTTLS